VNVFSGVFVLLGAFVALLAGVGLLRFKTPYARFHAAGKASPVAFLLVSIGAALEVGWIGAAELTIVAAALLLTLPASTHLLFRATHRTTTSDLRIDDLTDVEQQLRRPAEGFGAADPDHR
jgi:multicomponent Na+:H+ antiporter subunit G